jgi:hypothetical protein
VRPRRPGLDLAALAGAVLVVAGLACGEVPTLPGGVAYISPVILPSPAVAFGDTLRDSLGVVTPIKLFGIDNAGDTIRTIEPVFIVTTIPGPSVHITTTHLVIGDSIRTATIVGQVGTRLQTPPAHSTSSASRTRSPRRVRRARDSRPRQPPRSRPR